MAAEQFGSENADTETEQGRPAGLSCESLQGDGELCAEALGPAVDVQLWGRAPRPHHLQGAHVGDSALASGAWQELQQSIFSCCPAGLGTADVMELGKAENCGVI